MNHKEITERIITGTPMSLPEAVLYGVEPNGETVELGRHGDIYELLERVHGRGTGLIGIAVHTTGWAAPLDENGEVVGAPSAHPDRVRVALVATVTTLGFCSALAFSDGRETVFEDQAPGGPLWLAMNEVVDRLVTE